MIRTTRRRTATPGSRIGALLLTAVLLGGAVAGCSPAPAPGADAALTLQSQVRAVSEAAAAHDPASTLKLLDELVIKLDRAATAGDITFQRYQSILAAISALRTELTAVPPVTAVTVTAAPEAPAVPEAAPPVAVQPAPVISWVAPAAPVQAAAAAAAPPPAPAPAVQEPDRSKHGKGSGGDKDRGKDKD